MQANAATPGAVATSRGVTLSTGLKDIISSGKYKALLLDQFGVLHDGRMAAPGAIQAVSMACAAGLKIVIISNSSRRAAGAISKLARLGYDASCFAGAVTSGEMAYQCITTRPSAWWQALGTRVLHIGWTTRGPVALHAGGYGLEVVSDVADADFILAHGTEAVERADGSLVDMSLEALTALLQQAAALRGASLPMVVANPDLVTVDGADLIVMPGTLARAYAAAGGKVVLMGKPDPIIYAACADILHTPPSEILAVGDSLEHDIAGACAAGMDSLFIGSGIHRAEVLAGDANAPCIHAAALMALSSSHGAVPTYAMPHFTWT